MVPNIQPIPHKGADHIGLDEGGRTRDRAVHITLGGEIGYRVYPVVAEQAPHQVTVADIARDDGRC